MPKADIQSLYFLSIPFPLSVIVALITKKAEMNKEKALFSQLNSEDINELNTLLTDLRDFLISRDVNFAESVSVLLDEIASVQTDIDKLCIINSRDTELLLRGGTESLNHLVICALNNHITANEKADNQTLNKYRDKIGELFTR